MLTLREKHEYEQEIAQLKESLRVLSVNHNKEVDGLTHKHEKEVKRLTVHNNTLKTSRSMWRVKYKTMQEYKNPKMPSRSGKAKVHVQAWINGDKSMSYQDIADKFHLSRHTIKALAENLRKVSRENGAEISLI